MTWVLSYPKSLHWQTCLAPGPPPKNRTSSCACSNSKTCKTHRHSARKKEHTGSTLTARTGFGYRPILRKPLHWGWREAEKWQHLGGGGKREKHIYACSHMHTWCLWRLPVHEWPSDNLTTCLAQNFICCTLLTIYTFSSPFKAQTYLQFQIHLLSSEIHTKQVNLRLVHRSQLVLFGCTHRWGTASDLKQPGGVRLLPAPLWDVVRSTKMGPQERPKRQKHDRDLGHVILFTLHLTNPNKMAVLACRSWLSPQSKQRLPRSSCNST